MKLKRSYLRELQSNLTREVGLPIHTCESLEMEEKGLCLICFLYRNPKFGLLFSKILLDKKIINEDLVKEKYLAIMDLVGEQRIFEIIDSDLKTILKAQRIKCSFCTRMVPVYNAKEDIKCICGYSLTRPRENLTEAVPAVTPRGRHPEELTRRLREAVQEFNDARTAVDEIRARAPEDGIPW